jgi:hypothetical protein
MTTPAPRTADQNRIILTGENPFMSLSAGPDAPVTTNVSYWRIIFSGGGPGHVLFIRSELTDNEIRIYSDNIAMTRWLQSTVQGMLNKDYGDLNIPVIDAEFDKEGDLRDFWTERVFSNEDEISLTWHDIGEPMLIHTQPNQVPGRHYGVSTLLIPALGARVTVNGRQAAGKAQPREREGRPFSTCALAFSESWTEPFKKK